MDEYLKDDFAKAYYDMKKPKVDFEIKDLVAYYKHRKFLNIMHLTKRLVMI